MSERVKEAEYKLVWHHTSLNYKNTAEYPCERISCIVIDENRDYYIAYYTFAGDILSTGKASDNDDTVTALLANKNGFYLENNQRVNALFWAQLPFQEEIVESFKKR